MKRLILITILGIGLTGCAAIAEQKANWDACQNDPGCKAQAELALTKGGALGSLVGAMGGPGGAAAGGVAGGSLWYLITNLLEGAKLKKKKKEEDAKNIG